MARIETIMLAIGQRGRSWSKYTDHFNAESWMSFLGYLDSEFGIAIPTS
jgi:hypothetical protein